MRKNKKEFKMLTRTNRMLVVLALLTSCSFCSASVCVKLKAVSCGEDHSLVFADDNSLFSCGSNSSYVLGIGSDTSSFYTFQRVNGINGSGYYLQGVTCLEFYQLLHNHGKDDYRAVFYRKNIAL
jgi:alpha-tubulin suppressor-like RCC1 family protein